MIILFLGGSKDGRWEFHPEGPRGMISVPTYERNFAAFMDPMSAIDHRSFRTETYRRVTEVEVQGYPTGITMYASEDIPATAVQHLFNQFNASNRNEIQERLNRHASASFADQLRNDARNRPQLFYATERTFAGTSLGPGPVALTIPAADRVEIGDGRVIDRRNGDIIRTTPATKATWIDDKYSEEQFADDDLIPAHEEI